MNKTTINVGCPLATSNLNVCNPNQSQTVQSRRPSLPSSWMSRWRGFLSGALLLLICGTASAQFVKVVEWTNTAPTFTANSAPAVNNSTSTIAGIDLDDST